MILSVATSVPFILLLPLLGFFLLFLAGKTPLIQRIGAKVATLIMLVVWLLSLNIMGVSLGTADPAWQGLGQGWILRDWFFSATHPGLSERATAHFDVGLMVDHLTAMMLVVVSTVSFLVHLFSIGYMHGDRRFTRFFCVLQIFTFAMLGLVLSDNLLTLYVCWEIMGFASYSLIGHFYEKKSAQKASMKAFMTTRVGDVLMFVGLMIIWAQTGTMRFEDINAAVASGVFSHDWRFWAGVLVFAGAMGKSAQFPLHVWLPDAMEGPTPVSALIHAATMVAAGVYLTARCILIMTPEALLFVAYVGGFTAIFAASIALVMDDIKKVLAYSTISQLGYMMLGLGLAGVSTYGYSYGLYHLVTHAFFKACLFLGSGSIIHAMAHEQRMSRYGGLAGRLPITFITFLYATLCLCGLPFITSGFYSKDGIIASAIEFGWLTNSSHLLLPLFAVTAACFTTFYMFRLIFLTFTGKARWEPVEHHGHEEEEAHGHDDDHGHDSHGHADEHDDHGHHAAPAVAHKAEVGHGKKHGAQGHDDHGHGHSHMPDPHESPWTMTVPLMILAFFALILIGNGGQWFKDRNPMPQLADYAPKADGLRRIGDDPRAELAKREDHAAAPAVHAVSLATGAPATHAAVHGEAPVGEAHDDHHLYHEAHHTATVGSFLIVGFFTLFSALFYYERTRIFSPAKIAAANPGVHALLLNKYYVDEFYMATLVRPLMSMCRFVWRFDGEVIDGFVNAVGRSGLIMSGSVGGFDNRVVDGAVNSAANSINGWGGLVSKLQSGNVRHYLLGAVAGFTLLVSCFLLFPNEIASFLVAVRFGFLHVAATLWVWFIEPLSNFIFQLGAAFVGLFSLLWALFVALVDLVASLGSLIAGFFSALANP